MMTKFDRKVSLPKTGDAVWITAGDEILVRVMRTDEGVVCDMHDASLMEESASESHTAACYTFFNEVGKDPSYSLDVVEALREALPKGMAVYDEVLKNTYEAAKAVFEKENAAKAVFEKEKNE